MTIRAGIMVDGAATLCVTRTRIQVPTSDPDAEGYFSIYSSGAIANLHISMNLFNANVDINGTNIANWAGFNSIEAGKPVF